MLKSLLLLLNVICCIALNAQNIAGVINSYHKVLSPSFINEGNNIEIQLDNVDGLFLGQRVLLIQMKGAEISLNENTNFGNVVNLNEAGNYEFSSISSISGNLITLSFLQRNYNTASLVQLVGIPLLNDANINGNISAIPWSATSGKGGIVVIEVCGTLTFNANIDVSGSGFHGGGLADNQSNCGANVFASSNLTAGWKGEGISSNLASANMRSKGKNANGGGGGIANQSGGAGGAGYSSGGIGGRSNSFTFLCASDAKRANAGLALSTLGFDTSNNRIFLGGGGGAGTRNNSGQNFGGNGGGIIIIRANAIVANNHQLNANGSNANSQFLQTCGAGIRGIEDGAGGGGGAGAILLDVQQISGNLNLSCNGGVGSSTRYGSAGTDRFFGPGGGGGGGLVWLSSPALSNALTVLSNGGMNGVARDNACIPFEGNAYGATAGSNGQIKTDLFLPGIPLNPTIQISASGNTQDICLGDSITLNSAFPVNWSNGVFSSSITIYEAGSYFATFNGNCGLSQSNLIEITFANSSPIEIISSSPTICGNEAVALSISSAYQNILWSNGSTNPQIDVNQIGIYSVEATNLNGCIVYGTVELSAGENAFVEISSSNNGFLCANSSLTLSASNGFAQYLWSNGMSSSSIEINIPGTYAVNVATADGCVGISDTLIIQPAPSSNFSVSTPDGLAFCENAELLLIANGDFDQIIWQNGFSDSSIIVNNSGQYYFSGIDIFGCESYSDTVQITEIALPQASFSFSQTAGTYILDFVVDVEDDESVLWIFHDGSSSTNDAVSFTYLFDGFYSVMLIVTNACGNDTLETMVEVQKLVNINEIITPHHVYPNPFSDLIYIENQVKIQSLKLYDVFGKHVSVLFEKSSAFENKIIISTSDLSQGIYYLCVDNVFVKMIKN